MTVIMDAEVEGDGEIDESCPVCLRALGFYYATYALSPVGRCDGPLRHLSSSLRSLG